MRDGFDAERAESAFGDFADPGNFAYGERREKFCLLAGCNPDEAARLSLIAGNFCGQPSCGKATGAGKAGFARDGAKQFVRGGERWAVHALGAGEIEIGFIDGDHFHNGGKAGEDGGDAIAPFAVFVMVTVEKDGVRTKFSGSAQRHGGMNTVFAGFVAGGGDDAALVGTAADDYWLAAEVGAIEKLDGDEEGVHVDMKNVRERGGYEVVSVCMEGSKSGQVRHEVSVRFEGPADNGAVQTARKKNGRTEALKRSCVLQR